MRRTTPPPTQQERHGSLISTLHLPPSTSVFDNLLGRSDREHAGRGARYTSTPARGIYLTVTSASLVPMFLCAKSFFHSKDLDHSFLTMCQDSLSCESSAE